MSNSLPTLSLVEPRILPALSLPEITRGRIGTRRNARWGCDSDERERARRDDKRSNERHHFSFRLHELPSIRTAASQTEGLANRELAMKSDLRPVPSTNLEERDEPEFVIAVKEGRSLRSMMQENDANSAKRSFRNALLRTTFLHPPVR